MNQIPHHTGRFPILLLVVFAALGFVGCASQKPLPFPHSTPRAAVSTGPVLALSPTQDQRATKDNMDKVLALPSCIDPVLLKELGEAGFFREVEVKKSTTSDGGGGGSDYSVQGTLTELAWEVPNYEKKVGTAAAVSFLTGGVGGVIYGSTGTDVNGRAKVHFKVSRKGLSDPVLDKDYSGSVTERKAKFSCDTPSTYREIAAKALRKVIDQFKADLESLLSK